jgi:hypothetical protein
MDAMSLLREDHRSVKKMLSELEYHRTGREDPRGAVHEGQAEERSRRPTGATRSLSAPARPAPSFGPARPHPCPSAVPL